MDPWNRVHKTAHSFYHQRPNSTLFAVPALRHLLLCFVSPLESLRKGSSWSSSRNRLIDRHWCCAVLSSFVDPPFGRRRYCIHILCSTPHTSTNAIRWLGCGAQSNPSREGTGSSIRNRQVQGRCKFQSTFRGSIRLFYPPFCARPPWSGRSLRRKLLLR